MAVVVDHALLIIFIFFLTSPATATVSETEFNADKSPSSGPTNSVSAAESVTARSDIECSTLCSAAQSSPGSDCKSWAFASATGRCFLSSNRTFGFEFASSIGASIYRGQEDLPTATTPAPVSASLNNCTIMVGSRKFCVIQQRVSDQYSFARSYAEYENGFGDSQNFWIGLKKLNNLTGSTPRLFRMEAVNLQNNLLYVCEYSSFSVASASSEYQLSVSGYLTGSSNTTGESFSYNNGLLFSAIDAGPMTNCAQQDGGAGWWFSGCTLVNPNGYFNLSEINNNGDNERFMQWRYAGPDGTRRMLKSIRLMLQV